MTSSVPLLSVTDFVALTNQTLEYAYPSVEIEGEVASFNVNQGKFVFFDLKDTGATVNCFMMVFALRMPIEDGMKVVIRAVPKLTNKGRFSLTVQQIRPSGEGSLKKSFELLKKKLEAEGIFSPDRKRRLPYAPRHVAVISSTGAAGYHDFIKIAGERWGGVQFDVLHVQVQGEGAADQIIRAFEFVNQQSQLPEVVVLIRGGGSADDLAVFNDEKLVRAISVSRVPVLTGIGHEVDESLADLAADVRASTPSNAAEILVPSRDEIRRYITQLSRQLVGRMENAVDHSAKEVRDTVGVMHGFLERFVDGEQQRVRQLRAVLDAYNPASVMARGYAIVYGKLEKGSIVKVETATHIAETEVKHVRKK